jgi:hypothetical protein
MSVTYNRPNYRLDSYTTFYGPEVYLVENTPSTDGFYDAFSVLNPVQPQDIDPTIVAFTDSSIKFLFDNSYVYGHVITGSMYSLLKEYEANKDSDFTVIFKHRPEEPAMVLNHMSGFTEYLHQRLLDKGIKVEYIDSPTFYASNFINMAKEGVNVRQTRLKNVGDFFSEDLDYSTPPTRKVYLSRGKTTTYNGNRGVDMDANTIANDTSKIHELRNQHIHKFSDRIDDEKKLEDYLVTLGFEIIYPEDYSSYRDQLQVLASSKMVVSLTSSALSACFVMAPNTTLIEIASPIAPVVNPDCTPDLDYLDYDDHYKVIASIRENFYAAIATRTKRVDDVIASIENNPAIKAVLLA